MSRLVLLGAGLVAAAAVGGCAVGPNYARPSLPIPESYYGETQISEARTLADAPWWPVFEDPVLTSLIEEALRSGFDARVAAARVEEARARYGIARSERFPSITYEVGGQHYRADQLVNPSGTAHTRWLADVGLSWELDLWGRVRRLSESALAQYLASEESRRGVLLTLAAEVATSYLDLRELDAELEIARRTAEAFEGTYELFDRRLQGGAASALETARAEAALGEVTAQIPEIERAIVARENQINFLLGRSPRSIAREGPSPTLPPDVPPGLPSLLLERRPDIRQAEQLLVAANANVGVAKAGFFPRISLTGLFGNVSPELSDLFSNGTTWSIGAGLVGPLFQGGRVRRGHEAAIAQWDEARIGYEAAVVNALGEVSGALVDRAKLFETERQRGRAVAAHREAVRIANVRYASGHSAYFEVLEAQQQLFPAEIGLARTRRDQRVAVVALYRALGGGWKEETR